MKYQTNLSGDFTVKEKGGTNFVTPNSVKAERYTRRAQGEKEGFGSLGAVMQNIPMDKETFEAFRDTIAGYEKGWIASWIYK